MNRSYNWRTDPQFRLSRDHPRAFMRPQVQALLTKLKGMKMIDEPGVPEEIIWMLAFDKLHRQREEVRLAQIAAKLTALWVGMVKNEEGKPAYIFGQPENYPDDARNEMNLQLAQELTGAGDSPSFESQLKEFLTKPQTKSLLEDVLERHVSSVGRPAWQVGCGCGKQFAHSDEWKSHVRIRLSRALLDEFPPIGGTDG